MFVLILPECTQARKTTHGFDGQF